MPLIKPQAIPIPQTILPLDKSQTPYTKIVPITSDTPFEACRAIITDTNQSVTLYFVDGQDTAITPMSLFAKTIYPFSIVKVTFSTGNCWALY